MQKMCAYQPMNKHWNILPLSSFMSQTVCKCVVCLWSICLFIHERKVCLFSLFRHKKSVNEDVSLLIKMSSPKLYSAPFNNIINSDSSHSP